MSVRAGNPGKAYFPDESARDSTIRAPSRQGPDAMKRDWVALFGAIATSTKLADLPAHRDRLFYLMLLPQCDSWGRIGADPRQLCGKVWPMLGETAESTLGSAQANLRVSLLHLHEHQGTQWLQVPDWDEKAGSIGQLARDRGESQFPAPSEDTRVYEFNPRVSLGQPQGNPAQSRAEQIRTEENRTEKAAPSARRSSASPLDLDAVLSEEEPWISEAVRSWVAYRAEKRQAPYTRTGMAALLSKVRKIGQVRTRAAMEHSMSSNYQGLYEPGGNGSAARAGGGKMSAHEAIRAELAAQGNNA